MRTSLMTEDAVTKAKTGAVSWLRQQSWISSKMVPVIEKAINQLPTWHSPTSNATLYRNIRADIKELSRWIDVAELEEPISTETIADKQAEIMCLCAEMIIYIAMSPDHTISTAMLNHPFKEWPSESLAVSWWAMFCDEFTHVLEKTPRDNYIFLHIILSQSATKATYAQHKAKINKLHKLLEKWVEMYKKPRPQNPENGKGKGKDTKGQPVVDTAHTTSAPQPAKRKAQQQGTARLAKKRVARIAHKSGAISEDDEQIFVDITTQNKPSYEQLQAERDALMADLARTTTQLKAVNEKYIKYKHMSKQLDTFLTDMARMHMHFMSGYQKEGEPSQYKQKKRERQSPEEQQEIEYQDDREQHEEHEGREGREEREDRGGSGTDSDGESVSGSDSDSGSEYLATK